MPQYLGHKGVLYIDNVTTRVPCNKGCNRAVLFTSFDEAVRLRPFHIYPFVVVSMVGEMCTFTSLPEGL